MNRDGQVVTILSPSTATPIPCSPYAYFLIEQTPPLLWHFALGMSVDRNGQTGAFVAAPVAALICIAASVPQLLRSSGVMPVMSFPYHSATLYLGDTGRGFLVF